MYDAPYPSPLAYAPCIHRTCQRESDATDGGKAVGGSMGGATGPVLSGDMLFVNSGYGIYFHMPGAVLLAFGPPDKE